MSSIRPRLPPLSPISSEDLLKQHSRLNNMIHRAKLTRKGSLKRIVNSISGNKHEEEEMIKNLCQEPFQEPRMLLSKVRVYRGQHS
jgi:hypothetical protein